jgi:flagellin-like hook-associated protein FlgL
MSKDEATKGKEKEPKPSIKVAGRFLERAGRVSSIIFLFLFFLLWWLDALHVRYEEAKEIRAATGYLVLLELHPGKGAGQAAYVPVFDQGRPDTLIHNGSVSASGETRGNKKIAFGGYTSSRCVEFVSAESDFIRYLLKTDPLQSSEKVQTVKEQALVSLKVEILPLIKCKYETLETVFSEKSEGHFFFKTLLYLLKTACIVSLIVTILSGLFLFFGSRLIGEGEYTELAKELMNLFNPAEAASNAILAKTLIAGGAAVAVGGILAVAVSVHFTSEITGTFAHSFAQKINVDPHAGETHTPIEPKHEITITVPPSAVVPVRMGNDKLLEEISRRVKSAEEGVGKIQSNVGNLQTHVGHLQSNVGNLQTNVGKLQANIR